MPELVRKIDVLKIDSVSVYYGWHNYKVFIDLTATVRVRDYIDCTGYWVKSWHKYRWSLWAGGLWRDGAEFHRWTFTCDNQVLVHDKTVKVTVFGDWVTAGWFTPGWREATIELWSDDVKIPKTTIKVRAYFDGTSKQASKIEVYVNGKKVEIGKPTVQITVKTDKATVNVGEVVTVYGYLEGFPQSQWRINLLVNGNVVDTKDVTLDNNGKGQVSFHVKFDIPDEYKLCLKPVV